MAEVLKAIVFGVIQGITEWFPISSTGHLILLEEIMPLQSSKAFLDAFFVLVQLSSILSVVILYFHKIWPFGRDQSVSQKRDIWRLWFRIFIAALPAGIVGILFDDTINMYLYNSMVVAVALVAFGVLFLVLEKRQRQLVVTKIEALSNQKAWMIGMFQMLALIPGTSRSGATIFGAMILGCSRTVASEFSFVLAIPVMAGASLLKLVKTGFAFTPMEWAALMAGCLSSFLVSAVAVRSLLTYVRKRGFQVFGYYRIALGLAIIVYFWMLRST